jgi:hypothetical protein
MIICLDGVDGSGKSTLANRIVAELRKRYPEDKVILKHAVQIKTDVYTEYTEPFTDYVPGSGVHYVLDRWHIGENIYGPLYRKKTAFNIVSYRWTELFLASLGMRTWLVNQTLEVLKSRLSDRGEDFLQDKHIQYVKDQYENLVPSSVTYAKTIVVDPKDDELIDIIIRDAIYSEQRAQLFKSLGVNYFGRTNVDPRTILVVENKKSNKNFDPRINKDAAKMLTVLPEKFWQTFAVVSSGSLDKLEEFLTEVVWSASALAYGETVVARLKLRNIPFSEIKPPEVTSNYSYHIRVMSDRVGKIEETTVGNSVIIEEVSRN